MFLFSLLLCSLSAFSADYETIVQDTVFNTSSKVVIDEETIRKSRAPNITSLLSTQANVAISSSSTTPNSIFLRGGDSGHIIILIDGVPYYDASTIQRSINLNSLDIKTVKKIEIIKGSQTVLYGGQALSGVIKIETIPDDERRTKINVEGGVRPSQEMRESSKQSVAAQVIRSSAGGIKAGMHAHLVEQRVASPTLYSGKTYPSFQRQLDLFLKPSQDQDLTFKAGYLFDQSELATVSAMSRGADTDDYKNVNKNANAAVIWRSSTAQWKPRLYLAAQRSNRTFDQPGNTFANQDYVSSFDNYRFEVTPIKTASLKLDFGSSWQIEKLDYRNSGNKVSDNDSQQSGFFLKTDVPISPALTLAAGVRRDLINSQDPIDSFQAGLTAYEHTKFEASTGARAPSLFQLYSSYGNRSLKPETSTNYSVTQEIPLSRSSLFSVTAFESKFSDLILFQGSSTTGKYYNIAESKTQGVETLLTLNAKPLGFQFAYGYQEPWDATNRRWLFHRALNTGSLRALYDDEKLSASLEYAYTGERLGGSGNTALGTLSAYEVVNASLGFTLNADYNVYLRGNNILNNRYEEAYGFHNEGAVILLGLEYLSF